MNSVPAPSPNQHLLENEFGSIANAFALMQHSVGDYALFFVSCEGRILSWNPGVKQVFGFDEKGFVGQHVSVLFSPEEGGAQRCALEMQRAACEGRSLDVGWHVHADGRRQWTSGVIAALRDADGTLRGYFKICRDESVKLRLQQENEALLQSEQQARLAAETAQRAAEIAKCAAEEARHASDASDRAKDEFITLVTHELRAPLNVIMGWADLLREGALEPEAHTQGLDTIDRNARAIARLVEDLLDLSRLREGRIRLEMQPLELGVLLEHSLAEIRPEAERRNIVCRAEIAPARVLADEIRLQQIIGNLLSNAAKFTPAGGEIVVTLATCETMARICVRDNGQGILPEFLPHVFDRFQQQKLAAGGGLGLGLSIVRALVEKHSGTIEAFSEGENKGAEFVIELPLMSCESAA